MAPKRAFGGVLRPFGGGFRGPNRERASVFSSAGRGRAGGSAVEPGRDQRVQRRGTGRCRWFCGGARGTKKTDLGPFTSISATLLCYSTGFCSGMLVRYTLPHDNGSALREPVSFAGDFRQHVLLQQPVCLRFRSARRSGVTAVKASAIRSLSRSAARRSGLSRLAAGISAVRVAPVKASARRPGHSSQPPGSQFSAVRGLGRPQPGTCRPRCSPPPPAGVTAPPRQYGRPPATGESPASSLRRASPARDSTAYRPAP